MLLGPWKLLRRSVPVWKVLMWSRFLTYISQCTEIPIWNNWKRLDRQSRKILPQITANLGSQSIENPSNQWKKMFVFPTVKIYNCDVFSPWVLTYGQSHCIATHSGVNEYNVHSRGSVAISTLWSECYMSTLWSDTCEMATLWSERAQGAHSNGSVLILQGDHTKCKLLIPTKL